MRLLRLVALSWILLLSLSACGSASAAAPGAGPDRQPIPSAPTAPGLSSGPKNPARLIIAGVGIDARVELVGVKANGDLATPTESPWDDVGWYNGGPLPAQQGSAVIDGHVDRPGSLPAVFWHLGDVRVGDAVLVIDTAGQTWQFHVLRLAYYHPQDAPLQDIFGNEGGIYLNLITCAGDWIPSQGQTTLRLVVYTELDRPPTA